MTRTDVMASSRPRGAGEVPVYGRVSRPLRVVLLVPALVAIALMLGAPGAAVAAGTTTTNTSGYNSTPTTPTTTTPTTTTPEPKTGTSPTTEEGKAPEPKEEAAKTSTTTSTAKAGTLPFTGLDLRWVLAFGFVLMAGGVSIIVVQRRLGRGSRR